MHANWAAVCSIDQVATSALGFVPGQQTRPVLSTVPPPRPVAVVRQEHHGGLRNQALHGDRRAAGAGAGRWRAAARLSRSPISPRRTTTTTQQQQQQQQQRASSRWVGYAGRAAVHRAEALVAGRRARSVAVGLAAAAIEQVPAWFCGDGAPAVLAAKIPACCVCAAFYYHCRRRRHGSVGDGGGTLDYWSFNGCRNVVRLMVLGTWQMNVRQKNFGAPWRASG